MLAERIQFYNTRKGPIAILMVTEAEGSDPNTCLISHDCQKMLDWVTQHPDLMADTTCTKMMIEIRASVPYVSPHPMLTLTGEGAIQMMQMLIQGNGFFRSGRRIPYIRTMGILKGVTVNGVDGFVCCHLADPNKPRYASALLRDDTGLFTFFTENLAVFADSDDPVPGIDRTCDIIALPEAIATATMIGDLMRKGILPG